MLQTGVHVRLNNVQVSRSLHGRVTNYRRKTTTCAVKARWCLDIKYGKKLEAVSLLQEWVQNIGSVAGLTPDNTAINSGSVGTPESRLELEVEFDNLAELEQFWASIPPDTHKVWSQNIQSLIVHGSPTWEIFRTVEAFPSASAISKQFKGTIIKPTKPSKENPSSNSGGESLVIASGDDIEKFGEGGALPGSSKTTPSGLSIVDNVDDAEVVLDWKGEPMKINPGDKLPFKF